MSTNVPTPFDPEETNTREIIASPKAPVVNYGEYVRRAGLAGEPTTAENLVNTTFDILRAKPFDSSFEAQDHAWYCVVRPVDSDKLYSVTLGGQAVVEVLDIFSQSNENGALRVTLRYKQGGKYNGYYFFE